jgi:hypothetical protein
MRFLFLSISISVLFQIVFSDLKDFRTLDSNGHEAIQAAEFSVRELSKLSDSGIYTSLSLSSILSAKYNEGIFHNNIILELELASPHFKSGYSVERFHVVVMKHKDDGVTSFAIDEFPVMDEDSIEEYYIKKVEEKRRRREESFRRLELEAYLSNKDDYVSAGENTFQEDDSVEFLLSTLDTPDKLENRKKKSDTKLQQGDVNHNFIEVFPLKDLQQTYSILKQLMNSI